MTIEIVDSPFLLKNTIFPGEPTTVVTGERPDFSSPETSPCRAGHRRASRGVPRGEGSKMSLKRAESCVLKRSNIAGYIVYIHKIMINVGYTGITLYKYGQC